MSLLYSKQFSQPLSLSGSFTGSLQGTASYANYASSSLSASYATTASYAITASYAMNGGGGPGTVGPGTPNILAKFLTETTVGDSQIFDDGSYIGIGTNTPEFFLDIRDETRITGNIYHGIDNNKGGFASNQYTVLRKSVPASNSRVLFDIDPNLYFSAFIEYYLYYDSTVPVTRAGNIKAVLPKNYSTDPISFTENVTEQSSYMDTNQDPPTNYNLEDIYFTFDYDAGKDTIGCTLHNGNPNYNIMIMGEYKLIQI